MRRTPLNCVHSALFSLVFLLGSSTLASQQAPVSAEKCGNAPSIEGTTWDAETSFRGRLEKEVYEFGKGGVMAITDVNGRDTNATWKQSGACLTFEVNNHYVDFLGRIAGDELEGEIKPRFGEGWTIKARRRGAGGATRGGSEGAGTGEWAALRRSYKSLYAQGRFNEAAPIAARAAAAAEREFGPAAENLLETLNELALIFQRARRYGPAMPVIQRALRICEKEYGAESSKCATVLNMLAKEYTGQQKYVEAEDTFLKALAISERLLGPDDPQVAMLLNNVGNLYSEQDRHSEAEPYLERSLKLLEKDPNADKTGIALTLNNLAVVKKELGKYDDALMLYERSLGQMERTLGENHPFLAMMLVNLSLLYERKGWTVEAAEAKARAQRIRSARP